MLRFVLLLLTATSHRHPPLTIVLLADVVFAAVGAVEAEEAREPLDATHITPPAAGGVWVVGGGKHVRVGRVDHARPRPHHARGAVVVVVRLAPEPRGHGCQEHVAACVAPPS